jgi:hypothetical protein
MDLRKALQLEHSKRQTTKIVDYVGKNEARFKALVEVYLAGPYRLTQRAAWPLSICVERHPELIYPHLKKILQYVVTPGVHDAVRRNTVRLLQYIDLPPEFHGQVAEICFGFLQKKSIPVAVKVFSMTVLSRICSTEPDLQRELRIIIEDQLPYASAGFISRAKKILNVIR